ncbi:Uncharacterized protein FLJ21062-like protein [Harpegnathos saltator]|uniref:Uncharacterized protein FLJ21062-like protein n=1 Tax=Harpegnathos saltator TaxID=610380 RepID=E2BAU9_HARSA|nr:Uncharacterized protein FLJ21062-like protein [Harpegnathos saltator]
MYGERSVQLVIEIFAKCLHQKKDDFQVDQRLLLAIGCYVWECVARCPANLQIFLRNGGLYAALDVIETASYPVKCLYLGALTDMCDGTFCGPFLCTWRGADKKTGLMSLLAAIWREEEDRIGVKRRADGSIGDRELPQMGSRQRADTYSSKLSADSSPTIVDMIGSVRSKIFSIAKIIERDGARYEIADKHYKILLDALPTEDRVTMCCVNEYLQLKLGQMWAEVARYLEQAGITPLSVDAQLISNMVQWHRSWGAFIEESQRRLTSAAERAEEILEKEELARIRDARLAPSLDALDQVELIRRTADRSHMLRMKERQRRQVNAALRFPSDADVKRCHRTFAERANFTVILGQHQSIDTSHLMETSCDLDELPSVSPPDPDSPYGETFPSLDGASAASPSLSYGLADDC